MTKKEWLNKIALETGLSEKRVDSVVKSLASTIKQSDKLRIPGLGVFKYRDRTSLTIKNSFTGKKPVFVPARTILKFREEQ